MKARRRLPIQPFLIGLFVSVTLAIGLSIASVFYERMKASSLNAASLSFERASTAVASAAEQVRMEVVYQLALATSSRLARVSTFEQRFDRMDELWRLYRSTPLALTVYVGYPNGDYLQVQRVLRASDVPAPFRRTAYFQIAGVQATARRLRMRFWFLDRAGKLLTVVDQPNYHYDARTRPWFKKAKLTRAIALPPYLSFRLPIAEVTYSLRSEAGSVFGVDIELASFSDTLASVLPARSMLAAFTTTEGAIIAFSDRQKLDAINAARSHKRQTMATIADLHSPPVEAAFAAAQAHLASGAQGSYRDASGRVWLYRVIPEVPTGASTYQLAQAPGENVPPRLLTLAVPENDLISDAVRVRNQAFLVCLALILTMIPLTFLVSRLISRPIARLRRDALALRRLDFGDPPVGRSFITEIEELSQTFGAMRSHVREHNDAAAHFIPREFLAQLGRKDLKELRLGDHRESAMTMLFSDMRAFSSLAGRLTPTETFKFLNSYLSRIGPIIREKNGFIDKYIGDAIFALFPRSVADGLDAAIALQRRVVAYNEERARAGYVPVAIGIGVNHGDLMLGTIGEERRFETTVIADAVNIAARLEGLTKAFGALILAGGDVIRNVDVARYCLRNLGSVLMKGATHHVTVFEVCDADPPELLAHKMRTKERFDLARVAYADGHFAEAARIFGEIERDNEHDGPATYFRQRATIMASTLPELQWDGVEHMETK